MNDLMLKIENVSKEYRLGQIGGTTLYEELQRLQARLLGKEDPTKKIGSKDFVPGEKFFALDNVSFEVKKGERVGIIGHNGAGKSTLLKLICRVTAPTRGEIGLNGRITSMLEVGTGFHPELTGRENIYMNGAILGMTRKEIDAKIEDIIDFSEVRQFIDTPVKRYSSGMYVKLAFSVAAHLDSDIMIMDEVLAVGDTRFQQKCLDMMGVCSRKQGRTILYVSHNLSTIQHLCSRAIVMEHGHLVYDGTPDDAIAFYMKNDNVGETYVDVSKRTRPQWCKEDARLDSFELLNAENCQVQANACLQIRVKWHAVRDVANPVLRLYLKHKSSTPVGCATIGLGSARAGQTRDEVYKLDLLNVRNGRYSISAEIHTIVMPGDEPLCQDGSCGPLFVIDITGGEKIDLENDRPDYTATIPWRHSNWGCVKFDLTLVK